MTGQFQSMMTGYSPHIWKSPRYRRVTGHPEG